MSAVRSLAVVLLAGVVVVAHFALAQQAEWSGLFSIDTLLTYTNRVLPGTNIPIALPSTGSPGADNYFAFMATFFWGAQDPKNARAHLQGNYLIGTLNSIWILMLVEAHRGRRSNGFLILTYLFEFLGELLGIGLLTPVWAIVHLLWSPRAAHPISKQNLGPLGYAIFLGTGVPTVLMMYFQPEGQGLANQQLWTIARLFHPIFVGGFHLVFTTLIGGSSTSGGGQLQQHLPGRRSYYVFSILVSGFFHASTFGLLLADNLIPGWLKSEITAALDLQTFFIPIRFWGPNAVYSAANPVPFATGVAIFLQWDNLCAATATVIWAASQYLEVASLHKKTSGSRFNVVLQTLLVGVLAGPAASAAYMLLEADSASSALTALAPEKKTR